MPATASLSRLPLPRDRLQHLDLLIEGLDTASLWWLSGYTAGLAGKVAPSPDVPAPVRAAAEPDTAHRLTIVYGSQTGNAKRVAEQLAEQAGSQGLAVRLLRADAYPQRELAKERLLYVVISTQGDGDAPDDARGLLDFLASRRAPKLDGVAFAVLGLGDTSYPQFCAIGRNLDARLAELGGKRLFAFGAADLDVETVAEPWARQALEQARDALHASAPAANAAVTPLRPRAEAMPWSPAHPFRAEVIASQRITTAESAKDVRHIELNLAGSGLDYQPGDSLGVVARNPEPLVDALLAASHLDGTAGVTLAGTTRPLHDWLLAHREVTRVSKPFLTALAEHSDDATLRALLQPDHADALRAVLEHEQPIDLLARHAAAWTPDTFVAALRPLKPRLYSIASSRAAVDDEAHLTIGHVEYSTPHGTRWGAASHYLATRAEGEAVEVYLERNDRFRLPADASRDVIMVGPGTGVAPFRGFVQERAAAGASGRNWLLFGNPHFHTDFLYQLEWQAALKNGSLARLDVAFSRDQAEKLYVQHRVREYGKALYAWLEGGAHLYVCGAIAMARDVEAALRDVLTTHGGRTPEAADEYLKALAAQRRYARDVY